MGGVPTVAAAATVGIRPKVTHSFGGGSKGEGKKVKGGHWEELKGKLGNGKEGYGKGGLLRRKSKRIE